MYSVPTTWQPYGLHGDLAGTVSHLSSSIRKDQKGTRCTLRSLRYETPSQQCSSKPGGKQTPPVCCTIIKPIPFLCLPPGISYCVILLLTASTDEVSSNRWQWSSRGWESGTYISTTSSPTFSIPTKEPSTQRCGPVPFSYVASAILNVDGQVP